MNTKLPKARTWITIIAALAVLYYVVSFLRTHDQDVQTSAELYEACVMREFGTTPSAWHETQGEYPTCEN